MDRRQRRVIVAVDFDNTITSKDTFPEISALRQGAKRVINTLVTEYGCCILILTCREGESAEAAKQFLHENGIIFMHFNENCQERVKYWNWDTRKLGADIYIDDKGFASYNFIDWDRMEYRLYELVKYIKSDMKEI